MLGAIFIGEEKMAAGFTFKREWLSLIHKRIPAGDHQCTYVCVRPLPIET